MTQRFPDFEVKKFVENLLSSKPTDIFYLRGTNKVYDNWQEVIRNNGEYANGWKESIVKSFKNILYVT